MILISNWIYCLLLPVTTMSSHQIPTLLFQVLLILSLVITLLVQHTSSLVKLNKQHIHNRPLSVTNFSLLQRDTVKDLYLVYLNVCDVHQSPMSSGEYTYMYANQNLQ